VFRASFQRRASRLVILLSFMFFVIAWGFCVHGELLDCIQARISGDAVDLLLTTDQDGEVRIAIGDNVITFAVQAYEQLDTGRLQISGALVEIDVFAGNELIDQCTIDVDSISGDYEAFCCDSKVLEMSVEIPAELSEEIEWANEDHMYWFYVYEASVVAFDVDAGQYGSSLDAVLELYDEYGVSLDYSDDWDGSDPYLEVSLLPGLYYVEVRGYSGESVGWYELYIDWSPDEGIDGIDVEIPASLSGSIDAIEEDDFYCFYVYEPGIVTFDVDAAQYESNLDAVLELYDGYGTEIAYNDDTDGHDPYLEVYLETGSYCVKVRGCGHDSTGWYELRIQYLDGLGTGSIQVTLRWTANVDLDLWVEDPTGTVIYYGDRTPESSTGRMDRDANAACDGLGIFDNSYVENIFYSASEGATEAIPVPVGTFRVTVEFYSDCREADTAGMQVTAQLEIWFDDGTRLIDSLIITLRDVGETVPYFFEFPG